MRAVSYFSACIVLLTVRTHGPYYTNSGYLPCARAHSPFRYRMVNYRATDQAVSKHVNTINVKYAATAQNR